MRLLEQICIYTLIIRVRCGIFDLDILTNKGVLPQISRSNHDQFPTFQIDQEEAFLRVDQILDKNRYFNTREQVHTKDGYILSIYRVGHPNDTFFDSNKPPVLMFHDCSATGADFLMLGPGNALGYLLADEGYDVWILTNRGPKESGGHQKYKSAGLFMSNRYWEWTYHEIGVYDFSAAIDHVLAVTERQNVSIVGWSQGASATFLLLSERPEYNQKINVLVAWAPPAYMNGFPNIILRFAGSPEKYGLSYFQNDNILYVFWLSALEYKVSSYEINPQPCSWVARYLSNCKIAAALDELQSTYHSINFGVAQGAFLAATLFLLFIKYTAVVSTVGAFDLSPYMPALRRSIVWMCSPGMISQPFCVELFRLIFSYKDVVPEALAVYLGHNPAETSTNIYIHYYHSIIGKFRTYMRWPWSSSHVYNLDNVAVPTYMYAAFNDGLVSHADVTKLSLKISRAIREFKILPGMAHEDFIIGRYAKERVYMRTIEVLNEHNRMIRL